MKTLFQIAIFAMVSALSTSTFAYSGPTPSDKGDSLEEQLLELIGNPDFEFSDNSSIMVKFLINVDNEIIVVNIDAQDDDLGSFVKYKLNEQILDGGAYKTNTLYSLPVKFELR